jgi:tRNA pseudouridine38-40 synthase
MQTDRRTVEGEFVAACVRLSLFDDWRKAGFLFAGRTDRGVHACGQVAAFSTTEPERAVHAINTQLPPDCWCSGYSEVSPAFHPRYDAKFRTYRYYFEEGRYDVEAMGCAAGRFLGNHNFTTFARVEDKNPYRTILAAAIFDQEDYVFLEVTAASFLWHQVRCMATALIRVGLGEASDSSVTELLSAPAGKPLQPASAEGLILWETGCGLTWHPLGAGRRSMLFLDNLRRHHARMENVCRVMTLLPGHHDEC